MIAAAGVALSVLQPTAAPLEAAEAEAAMAELDEGEEPAYSEAA